MSSFSRAEDLKKLLSNWMAFCLPTGMNLEERCYWKVNIELVARPLVLERVLQMNFKGSIKCSFCSFIDESSAFHVTMSISETSQEYQCSCRSVSYSLSFLLLTLTN